MNIPKPFNSWEEYFLARDAFYNSVEWHELRKKVIAQSDGKCVYCGCVPTDKNPINIDHIIPLCKRWDLRLDIDNLQLTCSKCNKLKGGKSHKRFKKRFAPKIELKDATKSLKGMTKSQRRKERLKRKKIKEEKEREEQKAKNYKFFSTYLK